MEGVADPAEAADTFRNRSLSDQSAVVSIWTDDQRGSSISSGQLQRGQAGRPVYQKHRTGFSAASEAIGTSSSPLGRGRRRRRSWKGGAWRTEPPVELLRSLVGASRPRSAEPLPINQKDHIASGAGAVLAALPPNRCPSPQIQVAAPSPTAGSLRALAPASAVAAPGYRSSSGSWAARYQAIIGLRRAPRQPAFRHLRHEWPDLCEASPWVDPPEADRCALAARLRLCRTT